MLHSYVAYSGDLTDAKLVAASKGMAYAFGFNWIKSVTGRATEFDKAVYSDTLFYGSVSHNPWHLL